MDHFAIGTLGDGPRGRIPCRRGRPPGIQPACRIGGAAIWLCGLALLLSGCPQPAAAPNTDKGELVVANSDACSELLHDLCERLLLYWAAHRDLPATLAELGNIRGRPAANLACPISKKPYVYNFDGLEVPSWPGRLIVYDSAPSHGGRRWAILAEPPQIGKPLMLRVVRPPESVFAPVRRGP